MPSIKVINLGIRTKNSCITSVSLLELCSSIFTADTGGRMALFLDTRVLAGASPERYFSACHRSVFPHWYRRDNPNRNRSRATLRSWSSRNTPLRTLSVLLHTVTIVSSKKQRGEIEGRAKNSSAAGFSRTSSSKYSTRFSKGLTVELCSYTQSS